MHKIPGRPSEPRPTEPARIPPADPIGRALSAELGSVTERIEQLWQEYFQKELGGDLGDIVSFPDWLRARGELR